MKVAITGANEFVGATLCKHFRKAGHEIIALGNQEKPNASILEIAKYIQIDISAIIPEIEADVCIHTAALSSDRDTYKSLIINNVEGTLNVVEAAKNCSSFIHISSSSVYQFRNIPVIEDDATLEAGLSDYGETKLLAESIVELNIPQHQKRLILRPRAIYGIGDRTLIPRVLRMIFGNFLFWPVKKYMQTSLTHIDNLAYAIDLFLAQKESVPIKIYNISDENPYYMRDLVLLLASTVEKHKIRLVRVSPSFLDFLIHFNSKTSIINNISSPVLNSLNRNTILNISKIKNELKYNPARNFHNSCAEIANWVDKFGGRKKYLKKVAEGLLTS